MKRSMSVSVTILVQAQVGEPVNGETEIAIVDTRMALLGSFPGFEDSEERKVRMGSVVAEAGMRAALAKMISTQEKAAAGTKEEVPPKEFLS